MRSFGRKLSCASFAPHSFNVSCKYNMKYLITILMIITPCISYACSFAQVTENFEITGIGTVAPKKPSFKVLNIERGTDDGNLGSCSDAGILTLYQNEPYQDNVGYKFEVVSGNLDDTIFQSDAIKAVSSLEKEHLYKFVWLDGSTKVQEPIDIKIKVIAVSVSGTESEPSYIEVMHPGVKLSWWKWW